MKVSSLISIVILISIYGRSQDTSRLIEIGEASFKYEEFNQVSNPIALLVLFNGGAGIASEIPKESLLPDSAINYQIKTIGIDQSEFYLTDSSYANIRKIVLHLMNENSIEKNLFFGGFSLGGFTSIRLSEMAVEKKDSLMIPSALFAIDPPLDHLEMRNYCFRELSRKCSNEDANELGKGEAKWVLDYYNKHFGEFELNSSTYKKHSCFTTSSTNGGNAKYLHSTPINMIHEIDIMWLIEERCRDLSDTNVLTSSKFINYLFDNGNEHATLTLTSNKGYRSDGRRHPHSWSIADTKATLDWLINFVE